MKRIGNGILTSIWADHWLPSPSTEMIITRRPAHSSFSERVSDLIDWTYWIWNCDLIASTFWPVDVHQILKCEHFLWRRCHEILPTRVALMHRHVWTAAPFDLPPGVTAPNFATGLCKLKDLLNAETFGLACVVCWNIWFFRNARIHDTDGGEREIWWLEARIFWSHSTRQDSSFRSLKC